jgi:signal peptide peptidase SppA
MKRDILIAEFLSQPWALMPEHLAAMSTVLARWQHDVPAAMEDQDATQKSHSFDARRAQAQQRAGTGAIAVIPLYGTIVQRANMATDYCGGTSTQQFTSALREAMADETIGQILIDIDSPGGSVYGTGELADEIIAAKAKKPVVAVANSLAASAAYWIGCAASEFYVTPGGEVGSIGVWMAHEDYSKALDEAGVKTTLISAGKFKTEGNPYEALAPEARDFMQSRVSDYYNAFTKAVAKGRNVGVAQVRDGMGQGRVLGADAALADNMVDGIATFDDVVKKMQRSAKAPRAASRLAQAKHDLKILG